MGIIVRPRRAEDSEAIRELHLRQHLSYELPSLDGEHVYGAVLEEDGKVTHAVLLRQTCEVYWLFDPRKETRKETLGRLLILNREMEPAAAKLGLTDAHCFLPPQLDANKKMQRTMNHFGWQKADWICYVKEVRPAL